MFNNAPVLHDQFVPAGELYELNSKYSYPVFMLEDYFVVDPFVRPSNQRVLSSQIFVTLNLCVKSLRQHSRLFGITNA